MARSPQAVAALQTAHRSGTLAISPAYELLRDRNIAPPVRQTSVMIAETQQATAELARMSSDLPALVAGFSY